MNTQEQESRPSLSLSEVSLELERLRGEIHRERQEAFRFFIPALSALFVPMVIAIIGTQISYQNQFDDFKKEIRGEANGEVLLSLLGVNRQPLENQTIKINRISIVYRNSNGAKFTTPLYRYFVGVVVKNDGKVSAKSKDTLSYIYSNINEPDTSSDDPNFNNFSEIV